MEFWRFITDADSLGAPMEVSYNAPLVTLFFCASILASYTAGSGGNSPACIRKTATFDVARGRCNLNGARYLVHAFYWDARILYGRSNELPPIYYLSFNTLRSAGFCSSAAISHQARAIVCRPECRSSIHGVGHRRHALRWNGSDANASDVRLCAVAIRSFHRRRSRASHAGALRKFVRDSDCQDLTTRKEIIERYNYGWRCWLHALYGSGRSKQRIY